MTFLFFSIDRFAYPVACSWFTQKSGQQRGIVCNIKTRIILLAWQGLQEASVFCLQLVEDSIRAESLNHLPPLSSSFFVFWSFFSIPFLLVRYCAQHWLPTSIATLYSIPSIQPADTLPFATEGWKWRVGFRKLLGRRLFWRHIIDCFCTHRSYSDLSDRGSLFSSFANL